MSGVTVHHGDSRDVLKTLADASVDSVVTDPPYALVSIGKRFGADGAAPCKPGKTGAYARASAGFMGKRWDTGETAFDPEFWREVLRVLKPGGHLVAFGGTRTVHRLACAIEDAGFEIRDRISEIVAADTSMQAFLQSLTDEQFRAFDRAMEESQFGGELAWVFGSGFPKSHDVSKGIDRMNGHARPVLAEGAPVKRMIPGADQHKGGWEKNNGRAFTPTVTAAASAAWEGWGTALKPALEPIVLARKALDGTVASNVLQHGTGALNIDASRISTNGEKIVPRGSMDAATAIHEGWSRPWMADAEKSEARLGAAIEKAERIGRWPANILHDGSGEVLASFPEAPGQQAPVGPQHGPKSSVNCYGDYGARDHFEPRLDSGSAARFFYSAKADADDRLGSKHPTVKPVDLMAYLCRLVTPPKVFEFVCEVCDNPPHEYTKLQALQNAPNEPTARDLLLSEMQSGGREAEATALQGLRQADQSSPPEALFEGVPSDLAARRGADASSSPVRVVQDGVQAEERRRPDILQPTVFGEGLRDGEAHGADQDHARLLAGLSAGPPNGDQDGVSDGAPLGHGGTPWQAPAAGRGRAPSERGQGRQPPLESRTDDEGGTRPNVENPEEPSAQLPPLPGPIHAQQFCPNCKSCLTRKARPGVVLDPFAGSGSTGMACLREGFNAILIEREAEYVADIRRRIAHVEGLDAPLFSGIAQASPLLNPGEAA